MGLLDTLKTEELPTSPVKKRKFNANQITPELHPPRRKKIKQEKLPETTWLMLDVIIAHLKRLKMNGKVGMIDEVLRLKSILMKYDNEGK